MAQHGHDNDIVRRECSFGVVEGVIDATAIARGDLLGVSRNAMEGERLTRTFFGDEGLKERYATLMSSVSPVEKVKLGMVYDSIPVVSYGTAMLRSAGAGSICGVRLGIADLIWKILLSLSTAEISRKNIHPIAWQNEYPIRLDRKENVYDL
jgi:hypothetical protein